MAKYVPTLATSFLSTSRHRSRSSSPGRAYHSSDHTHLGIPATSRNRHRSLSPNHLSRTHPVGHKARSQSPGLRLRPPSSGNQSSSQIPIATRYTRQMSPHKISSSPDQHRATPTSPPSQQHHYSSPHAHAMPPLSPTGHTHVVSPPIRATSPLTSSFSLPPSSSRPFSPPWSSLQPPQLPQPPLSPSRQIVVTIPQPEVDQSLYPQDIPLDHRG